MKPVILGATATPGQNLDALASNTYPGRGIVIGKSQDGNHIFQIYWIMGRSEHSRNRLFTRNGETVKTIPFDQSKVDDPSLIIYNAMHRTARAGTTYDVVTNGSQTDDIAAALLGGQTFEAAVSHQVYEPDAPNYTPRISGVSTYNRDQALLSIVKRNSATGEPQPMVFTKSLTSGIGWCIHTYEGDGHPLPSFSAAPYEVPLAGDIEAVSRTYWNALNHENRISLVVKSVDIRTGDTAYRIINKHADV